MTDRRGLLGGICLVVGGVPLTLSYGFAGVGLLGLVLVFVGSVIAYGATQVAA